MNNQLTDNVKLLQKAALIHQGKVLLLKRSADSKTRPNAWDLPGGNSEWPTLTEPTENPHVADIVREIREETALEIDPGKFNDESLVMFMTFFEAETQRYSVICGWRVELPDDFDPAAVKISNEHTEQMWVTLDELDGLDFGEPMGAYVKKIIRNAFQKV